MADSEPQKVVAEPKSDQVPPAAAADSEKQKKKKPKKKKAVVELPPPLTDAEKQKYNSKFPDHPWEISHAAHKGRYLTAGREIKAGELVMAEYPYSFVSLPFQVSTSWPPKVDNAPICMNCGDIFGLEEGVKCDICKSVRYCDAECRLANHQLHDIECLVLKALSSICAKSDVDLPLCILVSRINATRIHDIHYKVTPKPNTPDYAEVETMVSHLESKSTEWKTAITNACVDIEKAFQIRLARWAADGVDVSKLASLPADELVKIAAKINTNSHGMTNLAHHKTFSLGLFPTLSLTSHSCEPNVHFTPYLADPKPSDAVTTRSLTRMELRALRNIKKGEELTINYIDTNETRENRQRALFESKHFHCQCKRCAVPEEKSSDLYLTGVWCIQGSEKCDGIMAPAPPHVKATRAMVRASQHKGKSAAANPSSPQPTDAEDNEVIPVAQCHKCKMLVEMRKVLETMGYLRAEKQYGHNIYAAGKYPEAMEKLQGILRTYTTVETGSKAVVYDPSHATIKLVPTHAELLPVYQMLMNIGVKDNDFVVALRYCKLMTDCSEKGYVKNSVELAQMYEQIGDIISGGLGHFLKKITNPTTRKAKEDKYKQDQKEAFQLAYDMLKIALGDEHPYTRAVQKKL